MKIKTSFLVVLSVAGVTIAAQAGPEPISVNDKDKNIVAPAPASLEWYRTNEWDLSLWGTYAFCGTDYDRSSIFDTERTSANGGGAGTWDRFLGHDHAWGGGLDAKYFFHRYFGVGVEGFAAEANESQYDIQDFGITAFHAESVNHVVGAALGTLTLRYPIDSSRFAPYVWAGGGGIFGGRTDREHHMFTVVQFISHEELSEPMGQFGGGMEVRLTPHFGLMADFSWCVLNGPDNNFGMARTGLNFSF